MSDGPYKVIESQRTQPWRPNLEWDVVLPNGRPFAGFRFRLAAVRVADELNRLHRLAELTDKEIRAGLERAAVIGALKSSTLAIAAFREAVRKVREDHER
jgi:hypothetical protein